MARPLCNFCLFALNTCICSAVTSINNKVKVIILQHPREEKVTKNTAKLLNLCLADCQIIKGESNNDFAQLRALPASSTVLLYPNEQAINLDNNDALNTLLPITHLIVIDGRSEEHTSELQAPDQLVCRLLLEKKKKQHNKC